MSSPEPAHTLRGIDGVTQTLVIPQEIRDTLTGLAFAAGGANVVMQLSRLPIGHGVALSRVDSGRVDKHPVSRSGPPCSRHDA